MTFLPNSSLFSFNPVILNISDTTKTKQRALIELPIGGVVYWLCLIAMVGKKINNAS
jgi:hypothetical protein